MVIGASSRGFSLFLPAIRSPGNEFQTSRSKPNSLRPSLQARYMTHKGMSQPSATHTCSFASSIQVASQPLTHSMTDVQSHEDMGSWCVAKSSHLFLHGLVSRHSIFSTYLSHLMGRLLVGGISSRSWLSISQYKPSNSFVSGMEEPGLQGRALRSCARRRYVAYLDSLCTRLNITASLPPVTEGKRTSKVSVGVSCR